MCECENMHSHVSIYVLNLTQMYFPLVSGAGLAATCKREVSFSIGITTPSVVKIKI